MPFEYEAEDLAALAQPITLLESGGEQLLAKNRIVYQPMEGNDSLENGAPSDLTFAKYQARAKGRAGIDIFEAIAVSEDGRARPNQLMLNEETRGEFTRLVESYWDVNSETPLLFQLTHSGRFGMNRVTPYPLPGVAARLLTDDDIEVLIDDLVEAVVFTMETGADGIDFKHCHGYLYGAFLAPANRARPGWSWGGETFEERSRFLAEALDRMMAEVPPDLFLYTLRLSAFEGIPGGFGSVDAESDVEDPDGTELKALVRLLEEKGVALINQSSGVPEITPQLVRQTNDAPGAFAHHQERAALIKRTVKVPVVGSAYSYARSGKNHLPGDNEKAKNIVTLGGRAIREGNVDLIGIGRQSLSDPAFARKLLAGDFENINWDTSCNRCAIAMRSGIPAACATYDPEGKRRFREMRRAQQD